MIKYIYWALILNLIAFPALAVKKSYDKITGLQEVKTYDSFAKYNAWNGNIITYHLSLMKNNDGEVKRFFVFKSSLNTNSLEENEPLFLLINNDERLTIYPVKFQQNDYGGMSTYWGFGISTYSRKVKEQLIYEINESLLKKIASAQRVDAKLSKAKFDIEGLEIKEIQKAISVFNEVINP